LALHTPPLFPYTPLFRSGVAFAQRDVASSPASLLGALLLGVVDQHLPHRARRGREEVTAALVRARPAARQLEVRLVDEPRGVERLRPLPAATTRPCDLAEPWIGELEHLVERFRPA